MGAGSGLPGPSWWQLALQQAGRALTQASGHDCALTQAHETLFMLGSFCSLFICQEGQNLLFCMLYF